MESNGGKTSKFWERFGGQNKKEGSSVFDIELNSKAVATLRRLTLRPNPSLAEFTFLALGKGNLVDEILVVDEDNFSQNSGLLRDGFLGSMVDSDEIVKLFQKLNASGRKDDLMIFGHSHPTGETVRNDKKYVILQSLGISVHDIEFMRKFAELNPQIRFENVGVVENTQEGPILIVYDTKGLLNTKRVSDIDEVPQKVIKL